MSTVSTAVCSVTVGSIRVGLGRLRCLLPYGWLN
uniref:Uncharacterized protein n=1 Tax=Anguilla anguilla TaxID=7936 RepID=A0A0E9QP98_ANGAN